MNLIFIGAQGLSFLVRIPLPTAFCTSAVLTLVCFLTAAEICNLTERHFKRNNSREENGGLDKGREILKRIRVT